MGFRPKRRECSFRSTNGGDSWANVTGPSPLSSQRPATLYVATARGILKSADDGATWSVSLSAAGGASTVVSAGGAAYAGLMNGDVYRLNGTAWL